MADKINIRMGNQNDHARLGQVTHLAIRRGASRYTIEQRKAWSPAPRNGEAMTERLGGAEAFVAETDGTIIGFMTISTAGYIDFAYILPEWRGQGIFRGLLDAIEARACEVNANRLSTHASLHAFEAFRHFGFAVIYPETAEISGVWLPRFYMEKLL